MVFKVSIDRVQPSGYWMRWVMVTVSNPFGRQVRSVEPWDFGSKNLVWIIESLRQRWSSSTVSSRKDVDCSYASWWNLMNIRRGSTWYALECDILCQSSTKLVHMHMFHVIYSWSQKFSKLNSAWPWSGFLVSGLLFSAIPLFGVLLMPMFLLLRPWKLAKRSYISLTDKSRRFDSSCDALQGIIMVHVGFFPIYIFPPLYLSIAFSMSSAIIPCVHQTAASPRNQQFC